MANAKEIIETLDALEDAALRALLEDERVTVRDAAAKELDARAYPEVAFVFVGLDGEEEGRFQCYDREGSEVTVESGETFRTRDPYLVAFLDSQPSVERAA